MFTLKVPVSTVASIIHKWKRFGTTRILPRACCLAKLCDRGEGPWEGVRGVTKNPMVPLNSASISLWREENLPEEQPSLQNFTNQACM
ncbi:hypothetical protein QTP70_022112, partial [Hemibagrus guttatus]